MFDYFLCLFFFPRMACSAFICCTTHNNEIRMIPNESICSLIMRIGVIYNYGGHYVMNSSLSLYN